MIGLRVFTSLVLLYLCVSPSARAASPDTRADLRCFIAAVSYIQTATDGTTRAAAATTALYYLGRLDGREPNLDLEKLIIDESHSVSAAELRSEFPGCRETLAARGKVISEIGQKLLK